MAVRPTSRFHRRAMASSLLLQLLATTTLLTCARGWEDCEDDDIYGIYGHCWETIQRKGPHIPPSQLCCSFIGDSTKLPCVCRYLVTQKVEKTISIPRLATAANCCGAPLDPGTKCGRYIAPVSPVLGEEECSQLKATSRG